MKVGDIVKHTGFFCDPATGQTIQPVGKVIMNDWKRKAALVYWFHMEEERWIPHRILKII